MDIKPPPVCTVSKKYLKKQRYKANKVAKNNAIVLPPSLEDLKVKLKKRLEIVKNERDGS